MLIVIHLLFHKSSEGYRVHSRSHHKNAAENEYATLYVHQALPCHTVLASYKQLWPTRGLSVKIVTLPDFGIFN